MIVLCSHFEANPYDVVDVKVTLKTPGSVFDLYELEIKAGENGDLKPVLKGVYDLVIAPTKGQVKNIK